MDKVVSLQKYKLKKELEMESSRLSEKDLASRILAVLDLNNLNIAIPIMKIAHSFGLKTCQSDVYENHVLGKLFIGDDALELFGCNQVIEVNKNYHIFIKRVVVASLLGGYFLNKGNKQEALLSEVLYCREIYDKYEEFVLNILAPSSIFIKQYNIAVDYEFPSLYIYEYLSEFFEVPFEFVHQKIKSLSRK